MDNRADLPVSDERSTRIPVDVRRFPWIRRLAADYAFDFPSLASFFSGDPSDEGAWSQAIARAQAHERDRQRLTSVIAGQQQRRLTTGPAVEAAQRLANPKSVAIVTGQQAGLFGGPLYTLLKALSAIQLAARISRTHGVPAVPIFWIEAEDHDWDEVRSQTVFDETLTPKTISLPSRQGLEPAAIASIRLDESVNVAIEELERTMPATEFRGDLLKQLREAYKPGVGMADAFGRWIEHVLGRLGLVVFDASDPDAKPIAGPIFARELSTPGHTSKLAGLAGSTLTAHGYHSQVEATDDGVALFRIDKAGRHPVRDADGLSKEAAQNPRVFSPNVLLRPIVQDAIFPTVAYVAGPSELAYLGQLREVYHYFGIPMPLVYPRASATIVDSGALRFLQKYELPLEALQPQDEGALNELLKSQIPQSVEDAFRQATSAVDSAMGRVIQTLPAVDPTLEGAAKSTLDRMQRDLSTLQGKMIQAAKRRDETLRRQFNRTRALAFPNGHPQEREIGFISFLNQYGPALVDRLSEELPLDLGRHWVVAI
jgi:bacillithiol biosynthesis cysteine-adding enzyme BshC